METTINFFKLVKHQRRGVVKKVSKTPRGEWIATVECRDGNEGILFQDAPCYNPIIHDGQSFAKGLAVKKCVPKLKCYYSICDFCNQCCCCKYNKECKFKCCNSNRHLYYLNSISFNRFKCPRFNRRRNSECNIRN